MVRLGHIACSHGSNLKPALDLFADESVEGILINGDLRGRGTAPEHDIKFERDVKELSTSEIPVLIIPGSHERKSQYSRVLAEATKNNPNLIDLADGEIFEMLGIATIPYGRVNWYTNEKDDSFLADYIADISDLAVKFHKTRNKPTILQMHEPPKNYGDIACFYEQRPEEKPAHLRHITSRLPYFTAIELYGEQIRSKLQTEPAGAQELSDLIEGIYSDITPMLTTFCHIHEAYQHGPIAKNPLTKQPVEQGKRVKKLALNTGPYLDKRVAITDIDKIGVSYWIKTVD